MTVAAYNASTGAGYPARTDIAGPAASTRDTKAAAREFAGLFYSMVFKQMQKTVPEGRFSGGRGEDMFRGMWVNEMGRSLAWRRDDALVKSIMDAMNQKRSGRSAREQGGL